VSVKEAAARLRGKDYPIADVNQVLESVIVDMAEVAHAYLYEHPADDDEPLDDAWMDANLDNETFENSYVMHPLVISQETGKWGVYAFYDGHWCRAFNIDTRGQARSLAGIVGFKLKETEKKNDE